MYKIAADLYSFVAYRSFTNNSGDLIVDLGGMRQNWVVIYEDTKAMRVKEGLPKKRPVIRFLEGMLKLDH